MDGFYTVSHVLDLHFQKQKLAAPPNHSVLAPNSDLPHPSHSLAQTDSCNFEFFMEFQLNSDDEDIHELDILDDVDSIHLTPSSEEMFHKWFSDAKMALKNLSNVRGHIPGNKVMYAGSTLNGKCVLHTEFLDKWKRKQISCQLKEMRQKMFQDHKKCTIMDFFHPNQNDNQPSPPPVAIDQTQDLGLDPRLSETWSAQTTPEHGNSPVDQDASSASCTPTPPSPASNIPPNNGMDSDDNLDATHQSRHSFIPAPKCEDAAAAAE